ncbi:MAG: gluconolaconase [Saprospiraceae bacterium]|nr:gluconolaconase [Saprospiraceae bacterium]
MNKNLLLLVLSALLTLIACKGKEQPGETVTQKPAQMLTLKLSWETDTILKTAESVFYDEIYNILYVSCIGAVPPDNKDGDGYLAKVGLNGNIIQKMWVKGLDAPKGMGKWGNKLYVTDITKVVEIDVETGQITNTFEAPGATFLNDITVASDGKVYISDSNTSTIYVLEAGQIKVLRQDASLGGPNGLLAEKDRLITAAFGSGNVYTMNYDGSNATAVVDSLPGGDGVVKYGEGYLISNWNGEVYEVSSDWKKHLLLDTKSDSKNAADIEIIAAKNLLLVPTFFGNTVAAYDISMSIGTN